MPGSPGVHGGTYRVVLCVARGLRNKGDDYEDGPHAGTFLLTLLLRVKTVLCRVVLLLDLPQVFLGLRLRATLVDVGAGAALGRRRLDVIWILIVWPQQVFEMPMAVS